MSHRSRKSPTPVSGSRCRISVDLSHVPWGADADAAEARLLRRPGVLDVTVDTRRRTAVVVHDGRGSLPQLWNWLLSESGDVHDEPPTRPTPPLTTADQPTARVP